MDHRDYNNPAPLILIIEEEVVLDRSHGVWAHLERMKNRMSDISLELNTLSASLTEANSRITSLDTGFQTFATAIRGKVEALVNAQASGEQLSPDDLRSLHESITAAQTLGLNTLSQFGVSEDGNFVNPDGSIFDISKATPPLPTTPEPGAAGTASTPGSDAAPAVPIVADVPATVPAVTDGSGTEAAGASTDTTADLSGTDATTETPVEAASDKVLPA